MLGLELNMLVNGAPDVYVHMQYNPMTFINASYWGLKNGRHLIENRLNINYDDFIKILLKFVDHKVIC